MIAKRRLKKRPKTECKGSGRPFGARNTSGFASPDAHTRPGLSSDRSAATLFLTFALLAQFVRAKAVRLSKLYPHPAVVSFEFGSALQRLRYLCGESSPIKDSPPVPETTKAYPRKSETLPLFGSVR